MKKLHLIRDFAEILIKKNFFILLGKIGFMESKSTKPEYISNPENRNESENDTQEYLNNYCTTTRWQTV